MANTAALIPGTQVGAGSDIISKVEWTLADFLAGEIASLGAVDAALAGFARTARDSVLAGGKRLRPTFAYWGWRGLAGPDACAAPVLPALAALELLHAFALVHDDVMDDSDVRRGRPTAHRVLAADHTAHGRRGDPVRFGRSAAVLVGDLCLVWADRLMAAAAVPPPTLLAARARYDVMRVEAVAGQYLDLLGEADPGAWSVERALRVARHKTAGYTVQRPLEFGAALALGGPDTAAGGRRPAAALWAYERYGRAVGEAFQLRDDLLGVYGDPAVTGKPAGEDLRTGKPTVLLMTARQLATRAQRTALDRDLAAVAPIPSPAPGDTGDTGADPDAVVARLTALIRETGAVDRVERMIDDRTEAALGVLADAPVDPQACRALRRLALAATDRRA